MDDDGLWHRFPQLTNTPKTTTTTTTRKTETAAGKFQSGKNKHYIALQGKNNNNKQKTFSQLYFTIHACDQIKFQVSKLW